jgi:hypothetical protein
MGIYRSEELVVILYAVDPQKNPITELAEFEMAQQLKLKQR